ncbi:Dihydroanticapsin 7-dehydrogenase [Paenibacillus allorhizosphaerae]|uniref:Dihydroanticapsin 7-dehydrogenase n=1 Tax=Paenibacillus allorhizosphaerae TaxID=2849866 RepID=A0ABM8VQM7_9BACL|nr:Dihydroanticapsin 7-dehydrogenase [Paenibacillus allorhizosphaerae]
MNAVRLKDKVAIVTGGTSGIGRESCFLFAREGAKVVVAGTNAQRGEAVAAAIAEEGGEAVFIQTDVTQEEQVIRMVNETKRRYGKIDVLFNNATWYNVIPATEMPLEVWRRTIDTTLTGPFLCCKYVIKEMMKDGGGSIINTSSVGGTVAFIAHPAYNAAKGGLNMLTKNLALDYGKYQIRANCISPGIIETPLTENNLGDPEKYDRLLSRCFTGRIGTPEDVASAALFLASDESTFITGTNLHVDNGWTAR